MTKSSTTLSLLLVAGLTGALHAQDSSRVWSFTSARLDSHSSNFIYLGYGYGPSFAVGAILYNPRSGYTELIGGAGIRAKYRGSTHVFAATAAKASDSRYVQIYYLPSASLAAFTVEATLQGYAPLDPGGSVQYHVSPLTVYHHVIGRLSFGASYDLAYQSGTESSHLLGLSFRFNVPSAEFALDCFGGLQNSPGKARLSFRSFH